VCIETTSNKKAI